MTEQTREEKRTRRLREVLPLYDFIALSVDALYDGARCSVPLSPANSNHVGIMHAGVLFALAEATGGVAISVHRDLARYAVIAKNVTIAYRRPATTTISAAAIVGPAAADAIRAGLASDPKHAFDVAVTLSDEAGRVVAEATCTFVLRAGA